MIIDPQIERVNLSVNDTGTSTTYSAVYYIVIYDAATGEQTPGNGIAVSYQHVINGIAGDIFTVNVIGTQRKIDIATYREISNAGGQTLYTHDIVIVHSSVVAPDEPPPTPGACDATIITVRVDRKESAPGAADGQITIVASSSQLPISYSVNGVDFQLSPLYTGMHGGAYIAYISDANGCTATLGFTIPTLQSLLIGDPSVDIGNGNISRWNAAFNPVVFTYQRRDFEVTAISANGTGKIIVGVNADISGVLKGDKVYLNAGAYEGVYEVEHAAGGQIYIDMPYISSASQLGYVNINRLRPYYQVRTEISYFDREAGMMKNISSVNRPDQTGLVKADISSFLQSLLRAKDGSQYNQVNYQDADLSASYTIRYAEEWDGQAPVYVSIEHPYYVVYAAKQLGDAYGGNLAAYVPFPTVNSESKLAHWVTDFAEPTYSITYPFDIGFIYSDNLAESDIYYGLTLLDINRQPISGSEQTSFLLNEDGSFLLNQDGTQLIIGDASVSNESIAKHIGLNRLLINQTFPPEAYYFTLALKYDEDDITHTITQTQTVRIDDMVDDNSVYLRWIGLTGSWNYYRFVYNQEVSLDVQNAVIIKNYVSDWANQDSIEKVISKAAGQKMKVMAEDLSVSDIKGLQSIKYSPKVQMLISKSPVKWQTVVLNTATFAEYETRNGQAPFSVTFNLPSLNIQTQ